MEGRGMMIYFSLTRRFRHKRGQLHVTETVLAATLILLLGTTITGITIQLAGREHGLEWLALEGYDTLDAADYGGLLRPAVFLFGIQGQETNHSQARAALESFLASSLPFSVQYSLSRISLSSGNQQMLIDHGTAQSQGASGVLVSYLLSGWEDSTWGSFTDKYAVRLELWVEI
jgi:hypothetical protein